MWSLISATSTTPIKSSRLPVITEEPHNNMPSPMEIKRTFSDIDPLIDTFAEMTTDLSLNSRSRKKQRFSSGRPSTSKTSDKMECDFTKLTTVN